MYLRHENKNKTYWKEGPSLIQPRELHACAIMDTYLPLYPGGPPIIVVAGGRDANETVLNSVEFYDDGTWIQGPDLPKPLYEPTMVSFGSLGVVLMGGTYSIHGPSSCWGSTLKNCQ